MSDEEPYEDDESIEDVRAAWNGGEKGTTSGPHDLSQRAKSIVDRAVARLEGRPDVRLVVVSSGTSAKTEVNQQQQRWLDAVDQEKKNETVTAARAYRVG